MGRSVWFLVPLAAVGSLLLGCERDDAEGEDRSGSASASPAGLCDAYCGGMGACQRDFNEELCAVDCRRSTSLGLLRGDLLARWANCIDEADCSTVLRSDDFIDECFELAHAEVLPSAQARTFCERAVDRDDQCRGVLGGLGDCLGSVKMFADDVLKDAVGCAEYTCEDFYRCIDVTFDGD